jgi:hypothetical protein
MHITQVQARLLQAAGKTTGAAAMHAQNADAAHVINKASLDPN